MSPTLYILMRTDMASMNPGKACAQAAHAASAFAGNHLDAGGDEYEGYSDWEGSTPQYFGTTIVLEVRSEQELVDAVTDADNDGFCAGVVHDPTYPVRDGDVTHLIPVNTCGYVFTACREHKPVPSLVPFNLHP